VPHKQATVAPLAANALSTASELSVAPAVGVSIPPACKQVRGEAGSRGVGGDRAEGGQEDHWTGSAVGLVAECFELLRVAQAGQAAGRFVGQGWSG